jgi:hypothetical protein
MKKIRNILKQKNILTLSYLFCRELRRGTATHFSKGESALPGDEKDFPDFQAEKVF